MDVLEAVNVPVRYAATAVLLVVVEIVSPGSWATDRAIKTGLYVDAGLPACRRLDWTLPS